MFVKLIFRCHKSPLYSHSGLFWLAGPTVPVTPHYLSDNARCNAPLNNDELIFFDIFANSENFSGAICTILMIFSLNLSAIEALMKIKRYVWLELYSLCYCIPPLGMNIRRYPTEIKS